MKRAPGACAAASRGFTLVELAVVVAMIALFGSFAVPGFNALVEAMAAKGVSTDLVSDLASARAEALKRNAAVTVSPVGGNWTNGWQVRSGDAVLGERGALRPGTWLSAPSLGVTFQPNGRLDDADVAFANLRWSVLPSRTGVQPRCVVVTPTGSARATRGSC